MIAAAIHENSDQMVTLGSAALKWNSDVSPAEANWWSDAALQAQYASTNAYLDFYQVHYYDCRITSYNVCYTKLLRASRNRLSSFVVVGQYSL